MTKSKMLWFRVSEEMATAMDSAAVRLRRDTVAELLREDCIIPLLQELGLWPSVDSERTLVDSGVEYEVEQ